MFCAQAEAEATCLDLRVAFSHEKGVVRISFLGPKAQTQALKLEA